MLGLEDSFLGENLAADDFVTHAVFEDSTRGHRSLSIGLAQSTGLWEWGLRSPIPRSLSDEVYGHVFGARETIDVLE